MLYVMNRSVFTVYIAFYGYRDVGLIVENQDLVFIFLASFLNK